MKGYLLDTSICIFLLRGNRAIEEKLNSVDTDNCYITDVVVAELMFGAYYSNMVEENLRQVKEFIAEMNVIPFDEGTMVYAKEKARLWKAGNKIEDFDLLIGSVAKANGLTMVTDNVQHFSRREGLQIENWVQR